ncbi:hypothetical protein [Streptomyces sp. ME19-01-6]|uniref:hypothetical protein n=1 Tax=Streptomyces sp. ME19-01-6 TaxID=3028686 RepID=UPI0029AFF23D|nr:hypothetical protein [Streptomyces sp. ME19-01-6]MDX3232944.1 hypothetical protein [Streptomyces sp. ME19-01-6]
MTTACPTPRRVSHPTQEAADRQRVNDRFLHGAALHPYKCRCSRWHLTRNLDEELPTYQQAKPEDAERLRQLGDPAFRALVDADAKKTAQIADRLALRHPDNLARWQWSLESLQREVRQQLTNEGTENWRSKAQHYDDALSDRLAECQALHTEAARPQAA